MHPCTCNELYYLIQWKRTINCALSTVHFPQWQSSKPNLASLTQLSHFPEPPSERIYYRRYVFIRAHSIHTMHLYCSTELCSLLWQVTNVTQLKKSLPVVDLWPQDDLSTEIAPESSARSGYHVTAHWILHTTNSDMLLHTEYCTLYAQRTLHSTLHIIDNTWATAWQCTFVKCIFSSEGRLLEEQKMLMVLISIYLFLMFRRSHAIKLG